MENHFLSDAKNAIKPYLPQRIIQSYQNSRIDRSLKLIDKPAEDKDGYSLAPFRQTKSIFIHIPKAAGISISYALYGCRGAGHAKYCDLARYFGKEIENYFTFSFVRDPLDRAYSAYRFLKLGGITTYDKNIYQSLFSRFSSFDEFVIEYLTEENAKSMYHFRPQINFLLNKDNKVDIGFIGRYESIYADFRLIAKRIGGGCSELPSLNITAETSRNMTSISAEAKARIQQLYKDDYDTLGY